MNEEHHAQPVEVLVTIQNEQNAAAPHEQPSQVPMTTHNEQNAAAPHEQHKWDNWEADTPYDNRERCWTYLENITARLTSIERRSMQANCMGHALVRQLHGVIEGLAPPTTRIWGGCSGSALTSGSLGLRARMSHYHNGSEDMHKFMKRVCIWLGSILRRPFTARFMRGSDHAGQERPVVARGAYAER